MRIFFPCHGIADRANSRPSHIIVLHTLKSNRRIIIPIQGYCTIARCIIGNTATIDIHITCFNVTGQCLGHLIQLIFCSRPARDNLIFLPLGIV